VASSRRSSTRADDAHVGGGLGAGGADSLVRLSVGIEDADDLVDDLRTALDRATA
jgi:cystathionine beta-lyase/cystathionine gamma-synthase